MRRRTKHAATCPNEHYAYDRVANKDNSVPLSVVSTSSSESANDSKNSSSIAKTVTP